MYEFVCRPPSPYVIDYSSTFYYLFINQFRVQIIYREQFAELFDEKARELNRVEAEYSECKLKLEAANRRLVDCDYKGKSKLNIF